MIFSESKPKNTKIPVEPHHLPCLATHFNTEHGGCVYLLSSDASGKFQGIGVVNSDSSALGLGTRSYYIEPDSLGHYSKYSGTIVLSSDKN